jgi:ubiquinone/menaquinone biosynthesis C-methylase UbiE
MSQVQRTYLPAAGHDWTLPLYDPMTKLLGGDAARTVLIEQATLQRGQRVLEVGCGTGALLLALGRRHPGVDITGLDPDPRALTRAQRKADRASIPMRLDRGFSDALPYADGTFDRVFSCFMFHHLGDAREKLHTLQEIRRVLAAGGRLHLLDFTRPEPHEAGVVTRWLHANHRLEDNSGARMLSLMREAGYRDAMTLQRGRMLVFRTAYYQALA